jgi:bacterioferritin
VRKLAEYERHESIDEMKHADTLAERILFLDGLPNFQAIHKLKVGETVEEILRADLAVEMEAIPLLRDAIQHCEIVRDYVSREIFERILESEEEHVDFLETQFDMIERMGLPNYIQLQSEPAGEG